MFMFIMLKKCRGEANQTNHTTTQRQQHISKEMTEGSTTNQQRSDRAHALYTKTFKGTTIPDESHEFPKFDFAELTLGKTLGEGGFGIVSEILAFDVSNDKAAGHDTAPVDPSGTVSKDDNSKNDDDDLNDDGLELQGRKFIADHCIRNGHDARYAVKLPKKELLANENILVKALADMVVESHMLSAIEHPNIVKLRATSLQPRYDVEYFIVMDRLYDTLETRLTTWATVAGVVAVKPKEAAPPPAATPKEVPPNPKKKAGFLARCFGRDTSNPVVDTPATITASPVRTTTSPQNNTPKDAEAKKILLEERLVVAFDLASALSYLHNRNIIYRDMKPENCAFDVRGDIKLFDFGTAKELPRQNEQRDKEFNLTGVTGSLPYMAPEVAKTDPYNHKCDVFSFAVLLWQLMALQMPFAEYDSDLRKMWEEVHNGPHKRPVIPRNEWAKPIELCLKRGWAEHPAERMEMFQIEEILKNEIVRVRKGDASGLQHHRRRSTFVFRR